jgi:hypothetical protein
MDYPVSKKRHHKHKHLHKFHKSKNLKLDFSLYCKCTQDIHYCQKYYRGYQGYQGYIGSQGYIGLQGYRGYQGNIGYQGLQGYRGYQGNIGYQGLQGYRGYQGNIGYQGYQGNVGSQGYQGDVGLLGSQGYQGDVGLLGLQGYQGDVGLLGLQGYQGDVGLLGSQGYQGDVGLLGSQGYQGDIGLLGLQGYQGDIGLPGFQGYQGDIGLPGFQGYQGYQGYQGLQGYQGFQGYQGYQGVSGDMTDGSIEVYNVLPMTVASRQAFRFTNVVPFPRNITFDGISTLTLQNSGMYEANYSVSSNSSPPLIYGLNLNGSVIPQSLSSVNVMSVNAYDDCLFSAQSGDTLQLINYSSTTITTSNTNLSNTTSYVNIFESTTEPITILYSPNIDVIPNSSIYLIILMNVGNQGIASTIVDSSGNFFSNLVNIYYTTGATYYSAIYAYDYTFNDTIAFITIENGNTNWVIQTLFITNTASPSYAGINYSSTGQNLSVNVNQTPYLNIFGIISSGGTNINDIPNVTITNIIPIIGTPTYSGYFYGYTPSVITESLGSIVVASVNLLSYPTVSSSLVVKNISD